jgi:hypothetical protein
LRSNPMQVIWLIADSSWWIFFGAAAFSASFAFRLLSEAFTPSPNSSLRYLHLSKPVEIFWRTSI